MPSNSQSSDGSLEFLIHEIRPDIEESIHHLVVDGFKLWEAGGFTRAGNLEKFFNIRMAKCMDDIRRKRDISLRILREYTTPTDEMFEGSDDPDRSPRIDIAILSWTHASDDAYLTIECKLLDLRRLPRRYVEKGIDRFVQGRYGVKTRIGAMIGYVLEGTPDEVVRIINSRIENILDSGHKLIPIDPIGWLETVYSSKHHRTSAPTPIFLTHLLFGMSDIGSYPLSFQPTSTGTDKSLELDPKSRLSGQSSGRSSGQSAYETANCSGFSQAMSR